MGGCTGTLDTHVPISLYWSLPVTLDTAWNTTNFWELEAAQCLHSPFPTSPIAFYHNLFTCWPFFWSCYSEWSVGWSLCDCLACLNVCVIMWVVVCVHACVCFRENERNDGGSTQDAFARAFREKKKVPEALFTVRDHQCYWLSLTHW